MQTNKAFVKTKTKVLLMSLGFDFEGKRVPHMLSISDFDRYWGYVAHIKYLKGHGLGKFLNPGQKYNYRMGIP